MTATVHLEVLKGRDLIGLDIDGASNVVVKVHPGGAEAKAEETVLIESTRNPDWLGTGQVKRMSWENCVPIPNVMSISVYHRDWGQDSLMGVAVVSLLKSNETVESTTVALTAGVDSDLAFRSKIVGCGSLEVRYEVISPVGLERQPSQSHSVSLPGLERSASNASVGSASGSATRTNPFNKTLNQSQSFATSQQQQKPNDTPSKEPTLVNLSQQGSSAFRKSQELQRSNSESQTISDSPQRRISKHRSSEVGHSSSFERQQLPDNRSSTTSITSAPYSSAAGALIPGMQQVGLGSSSAESVAAAVSASAAHSGNNANRMSSTNEGGLYGAWSVTQPPAFSSNPASVNNSASTAFGLYGVSPSQPSSVPNSTSFMPQYGSTTAAMSEQPPYNRQPYSQSFTTGLYGAQPPPPHFPPSHPLTPPPLGQASSDAGAHTAGGFSTFPENAQGAPPPVPEPLGASAADQRTSGSNAISSDNASHVTRADKSSPTELKSGSSVVMFAPLPSATKESRTSNADLPSTKAKSRIPRSSSVERRQLTSHRHATPTGGSKVTKLHNASETQRAYADPHKLLQAACSGNISAFEHVLRVDAKLNLGFCNVRDYSGRTCLHLAAWHGQLQLLQHVLTGGQLKGHASLDFPQLKSLSGNTVLHSAAEGGQYEVVDCLLPRYDSGSYEARHKPNTVWSCLLVRNERGQTPAECAFERGFEKTGGLLSQLISDQKELRPVF